MRKIVALSLITVSALTVANAGGLELYKDKTTGALYSEAGDNRERVGAGTLSKALSVEFSGTHYFGYTSVEPKDDKQASEGGFELRRNYLQAKGYFNEKDYFRVTLDATKQIGGSETYADVYVKYAYLYLDKVLPFTGVEVGIAHRPWIDYEEHNAWYWRSINKVALEDKLGYYNKDIGDSVNYPDVMNSADLGVNFKTKTNYFSSEIGIFNGEGYHSDKAGKNQNSDYKLSFEARLTGHILGNGTKKANPKKDTYANISYTTLMSANHKDDNVSVGDSKEFNRAMHGIHFVYNMPMFLFSAQYFNNTDESRGTAKDKTMDAFSINADIRPIKDWTIITRYDSYTYKDENKASDKDEIEGSQFIYGVAYNLNKYVTLIGSGKTVDFDYDDASINDEKQDKQVWMLTAEVKW